MNRVEEQAEKCKSETGVVPKGRCSVTRKEWYDAKGRVATYPEGYPWVREA